MDDQQRARELLAAEWRRLNEDAPADMLEAGCELPPLVAAAVAAITAALRSNDVALRTAMETLEQIATTPRNKGARMNAKATLLFLQTQGAGGPEGFVLVPADSVLPCGCGCFRVCCRSCGTELGGFGDARPQGVKDVG
ncbi:hypothetical protein D3C81_169780 [compost metagenome]